MNHLAGAAVLGRLGGALDAAAYAGQVVSRGGLFGRRIGGVAVPGLLSTIRAYSVLDLPFGRELTPERLESARTHAPLIARGLDGPVGPGTDLGFFFGPEIADGVRQVRIDRASRVVAWDQGVNGGIVGAGRTGVPGETGFGTALADGWTPTGRVLLDTVDGRVVVDAGAVAALRDGRLTPQAFAELVRGELGERGSEQQGPQLPARDMMGGSDRVLVLDDGGRLLVDAETLAALAGGRLTPEAFAERVRAEGDPASSLETTQVAGRG